MGPISALWDVLFKSYSHLNKGWYNKNGLKLSSFTEISIIPKRKCQKLMRSKNYIYRGSIWVQSQLCRTFCLWVIAIWTRVGITKMIFGEKSHFFLTSTGHSSYTTGTTVPIFHAIASFDNYFDASNSCFVTKKLSFILQIFSWNKKLNQKMVKKCKDNPFSKNYLEVLKWSNNHKNFQYTSKHTIF